MSTAQHGVLFRTAGPNATMDYLWSRLGNRDLSQNEALALISAVHRQLGQSKAEDPHVYSSYSRFMESLNRQMPVVHDFVVSKWSESRYTSRRDRREAEADTDEPVPEADLSNGQPVIAVHQVEAVQESPIVEAPQREAPEEPGEAEEDDGVEAPGAVARVAKEANTEQELEGEPQGGELEQKQEDAKDQPEENGDSAERVEAPDEGQQAEDSETDREGFEEQEPEVEQQLPEEGEAVEGEQLEAEGEVEQGEEPEVEGGEGQRAESGEEAGEWPGEEALEPAEPLEGEAGAEAGVE